MGPTLSTHSDAARSVGAVVLLLLSVLFPADLIAQTSDSEPRRPAVQSTTQMNPRGADVVEPMTVYQITHRRGEAPDTLYLGVAKIPDPRLGQEGAYVRQDATTGTMIRISDAVIIADNGLRRMVEFDPTAARDQLVFIPGPHDVVTSRQSVNPVRSLAGREVTYDLAELYAAAQVNPLTGAVTSGSDTAPRTAFMRMRSTYPGGESVDLSVSLVPRHRPTTISTIQIIRRDTTILRTPDITYVLAPPGRPPRLVSVIATLETGYGQRFVRTGIPATSRSSFITDGWADNFHVDGTVRLERPTHRWRIHLFGTSSLVTADVTDISHHQIALLGDLRFEYGAATYLAIEASGRMSDKPHQEFDWNSADYAGGISFGPGRRAVNYRGLETWRVELLGGLRMGENRMIEVYQAGVRARGIGPELTMHGHLGQLRWMGAEVHLRGSANAYTIAGRGARDSGFRERGLRLGAEVLAGQEIAGMFIFGAVRGLMRTEKAWYPNGEEYFMNDALATPAVGVEMRF